MQMGEQRHRPEEVEEMRFEPRTMAPEPLALTTTPTANYP